ncbi:restriction endonuclease subunit S [Deinococcus multiflagellatus]|uniref:Restriction endonuclease subunit S n=2 Tax=Deinococcus multiflagellatus TaxID=1656887 RepID=A0ABW1ZLW9_9DEIO
MTLGDVLTLQRGHDLPSQKRSSGSVPIVSSSGISDYHNSAAASGPGVVTGRYGTIGEVFYIEGDYWPLNTTLYVKDFKGNHPKFVYYLLKTIDFHQFNDKSSVPGVNRNHAHQARVSIPHPDTQRQIAAILSAFDDKIELNRQMNRTLEQMARALFKSWFVDFDPVRAKMRGEQPEGMDAETATLFPDEMEEVDGREVPRGWRVGTVGDIAQQTKEQIDPSIQPDARFAHFSIPAFDAENRPTLERGSAIKSNKFLIPEGAVLVSKLNPATPRIWDTDKVADADFKVCSTEFIPLIARQSEFYPLLLTALKDESFSKSLAEQASGTSNSHQRVRPADIITAPMMLPPSDVAVAFGRLTIPILGHMKYNIRESAHLSSIRDTLLPRLLSGEVDVSGWEGIQ